MVDLLNQKFKAEDNKNLGDSESGLEYKKKSDYNILVVIAAIIIFVFVAVFFYLKFSGFFQKTEPIKKNIGQEEKHDISSSSSSSLPGNKDHNNPDYYDLGTLTEGLRAEDLTFGIFYDSPQSDFKASLESYEIPLNIKTDVENYFKINRTFNIDSLVDDLNNYGFDIFDAQKITGKKDFYGVFKFLNENNVPIILSSDFILYYYQTLLKESYKDIEKNIFYANLWDMLKDLYNVSLIRYRNRFSELGNTNDALLEGERLEFAFWALALNLLEPTKEQVSKQTNLSETSRFSEQELNYFHVGVPAFLEKEVEEETKLIREGRGIKKSPILTFQRDYGNFRVPSTYQQSPKLVNFYLATRWLNTIFPLYEQSNSCPDCLLDKDDNLINFIAASFVTQDISKNQNVKNDWAAIYKFISFFRGLSQGYTFLNYNKAFQESFGEDYNLEEIFKRDDKKREEDILKIKDILENVQFLEIDGAESYVKKDASRVGMKILQDDYWPNDYILEQFIGEDMEFKGDIKNFNNLFTSCRIRGSTNAHRCQAFGMDIINLIHPVVDGDDYFYNNTNYYNYNQKISNFSKIFDKFDKYAWNNNIYWMTLDFLKPYLLSRQNIPKYMQSSKWQNEKKYRTALGTWVNMHLEEDIWGNSFDLQKNPGETIVYSCNPLNYIEPEPDLYRELIARNDMLIKMMYALKINKQTNTAIATLKDFNDELRKILEIAEKELKSEILNEDDCDFIHEFISRNFVIKESLKELNIRTGNMDLKEKINGMDILSIVYKRGDKKYLAFGPIFNYEEGK